MKKIILIFAFVLVATTRFGQSVTTRIKEFNLDNKVAIQGYDPVAYFKQNKAVKGKKEISASNEGIVYYFANQVDKELFLKAPAIYEPQYGGWCSYAMGATGEKVEIDPQTFKITDGKLNLFYNAYFNNTLKSWNKDEINLRKKADVNWKKFLK